MTLEEMLEQFKILSGLGNFTMWYDIAEIDNGMIVVKSYDGSIVKWEYELVGLLNGLCFCFEENHLYIFNCLFQDDELYTIFGNRSRVKGLSYYLSHDVTSLTAPSFFSKKEPYLTLCENNFLYTLGKNYEECYNNITSIIFENKESCS